MTDEHCVEDFGQAKPYANPFFHQWWHERCISEEDFKAIYDHDLGEDCSGAPGEKFRIKDEADPLPVFEVVHVSEQGEC